MIINKKRNLVTLIVIFGVLLASIFATALIYDNGTFNESSLESQANESIDVSLNEINFDNEINEIILSGNKEVPPPNTNATGQVNINFDDSRLILEGNFEDLSSPLHAVSGSSAHVHKAPQGENGPVVFNVVVNPSNDNKSGSLSLSAILTEDQVLDLKNGLYYINVHSEIYPNGEIRAQLIGNISSDDKKDTDSVNDFLDMRAYFGYGRIASIEGARGFVAQTLWLRNVIENENSAQLDSMQTNLTSIGGGILRIGVEDESQKFQLEKVGSPKGTIAFNVKDNSNTIGRLSLTRTPYSDVSKWDGTLDINSGPFKGQYIAQFNTKSMIVEDSEQIFNLADEVSDLNPEDEQAYFHNLLNSMNDRVA